MLPEGGPYSGRLVCLFVYDACPEYNYKLKFHTVVKGDEEECNAQET